MNRPDQATAVLDRYRQASNRCRQRSATDDYDGCLQAQDEMLACTCELASINMLHLITTPSTKGAIPVTTATVTSDLIDVA